MSIDQWGRRFRELVQARDVSSPVRKWLDQRYPAALGPSDPRQAKGNFLQPPHVDELRPLLRQLPENLAAIKPQLQALLDRHRRYYRESGDSFYLVRTFCNLGDRLLDLNPTWARGLAHALVLHGDVELGEAVYRAAIKLFPDNPVCRNDLAHILRITDRRDQAVAVYREAQQDFPRNPATINGLADALIDLERLDEAKEILNRAHQLDFDEKSAAKRDQIRRRLQGALAGEPVRPAQPRLPHEGPAGDLANLADITGEDLSHDPAFGRTVLLRRSDKGALDCAKSELERLPPGSVRIIETGLWYACAEDWRAASDWFEQTWEQYPGDGVLRVHHNRAQARAGKQVDWTPERERYPYLATVIETEIDGAPPARIRHLDPNAADLTEEQRQDV